MHSYLKYTLSTLFILGAIAFSNNAQAQVTMGLDKKPAKAAILELKTQELDLGASDPVTHDNNITSEKGGLVLPRVKLQDIYKLTPFLTTQEDADEVIRKKHAGLMVYNINDSYKEASTDPQKVFKQGVYMWDGSRWSLLVREEFKFFHMPSFVLDISQIGGPFTVDLYDKYIKQFTRIGVLPTEGYPTLVTNPGAITKTVPNFKRNELDYYITYYDGTLIKNVSVDDKGIMKYHVDPSPSMEPYAYLSIVFVVK